MAIDEQLTKYLTDAHSIEEQALSQLRIAPRIAGDPELAAMLREHLAETEDHERRVRGRLEAHGATPSKVKDIAMQAGGVGFVLFAKAQPDTPGKLAAHAYSYEHLEVAAYELLARVADRAGASETVAVAREICEQERAMGERLASAFDRVAMASLRDKGSDDARADVVRYLADAHAIESQSIQLLERAPHLDDDPQLSAIYREHLDETRAQQRVVGQRLQALGGSPSRIKDAAMRLGGLNWGLFFSSHPDTPGKLAAFAYAFEHLEIAGYELLRHVANHAGDGETAALAMTLAAQERAAAVRIAEHWDRAVDVSLREVGAVA